MVGPAFLLSTSTGWPPQPTLQQPTAVLTTDDTPLQSSPITDFSRYSNWTKTHKVTLYLLLFVENLKKKTCGSFSLQHLANGFAIIIKQTQRQDFSKENQCLTKKIPIPARSRLQPLCPFIDDFRFVRDKERPYKTPQPL